MSLRIDFALAMAAASVLAGPCEVAQAAATATGAAQAQQSAMAPGQVSGATGGEARLQVGRSPNLPPVSLERIRRALEREPALRLPEAQGPVFSVSVEGQLPSFAHFVGEENLSRGPAPSTSVTHREFLSLVAPPQTQSFGAFSPSELLQVAATSAAVGLGSQWLVQGIKDAIRNRREAEARREVQAVLAELRRRQQADDREKP